MENWKEKKQITYLLLTVLVLTAVLGVVTYAWLFHRSSMITMAPVIHPGNIAITGPGGSAMEGFDLSYSNDDIHTDSDGKKHVTIERSFCVKSTEEEYELEIVHTTNMKGLTFTLYASDDLNNPVSGTFLNRDDSRSPSQYKYATQNGNKHNFNFDDYTNVQVHAEPLYWKVNGTLNSDTDRTVEEYFSGERVTYYLTDYVLSITWMEENKETDMFYILAKNVE